MFKDNRQFIEALEKSGDLIRVKQEVDWDLEIGAITRRTHEKQGPSVLFENIKDYPKGFRVWGAPMASWRRTATAMGMPIDSSVRDIQNEYENRTRDVLRKYFGSNISDVYLCNHFSSSGERKNKADVCADIGVRLLIDDFLEIARDCSDRGIRFLLFGDYEWNQSKSLPTGVERAKNWREVLEKINDTRHK